MPRIATDYSITPVTFYRFVCNDPEITSIYVGHTVCFRKRKANHKIACHDPNNVRHNEKIYTTIRENGGWGNWKMIEIEKKICIDKRDAEKQEQEWIDKLHAKLNTLRAYITPEQAKIRYKNYIQENKEYFSIKNKEYAEINKERIKKYKEDNKEHIREVNKKRFLENIEYYKEKNKELRLKRREITLAKGKVPYACECGKTCRTDGKTAHFLTMGHLDFINSKA